MGFAPFLHNSGDTFPTNSAQVVLQETDTANSTLFYAKMSISNKIPEGLKDSECKKENLGVCPPIPYVPPMDLLQTKESMDMLKLKLQNGTFFSMTIFAKGNPEDYLQHLIAVQHLITQKALDATCRSSAKELLERASKVLEALAHNPIGPQGLSSKEDLKACKIGKKHTQEMLKSARKEHDSAMVKVYKFLSNLLASDPQAQWDCICCEMHDQDAWGYGASQCEAKTHKT
jgi:hypothetical protein